MKTSKLVILVLLGAVAIAAGALGFRQYSKNSTGRAAASSSGESSTQPASSEKQTPADVRIRAGESKIKLAPDRPDGYNLLASAYMQKARETGDYGVNAKAMEALEQSFRVAPDNYDALKLHAKVLLTYHRFEEALAEAERAQKQNPEDHDVYGALVDANVELGRYDAAVEAAQRMVDLRPDAAAYSRVAYLRELHGDTEGAVEAMSVALKASDPRDPEAVTWARVQFGHALASLGKRAEAEREYDTALRVLPGYGAALTSKADARAAAGDYDGAVEIYKQLDSHDAHLALGDLYARLGRTEDAAREYAAFERAEHEAAAQENDLGHLARFWADRGQNLDEASEIMRRERVRRADIYTCDTLAWVLYKKGDLAAARQSIDEALRLGTRDAKINYHAGMIYQALGDARRAARHLKLALETNPSFDVLQAEAARRALDSLNV